METCSICNGKGKTDLPISNIFTASVQVHVCTLGKHHVEKKRVRLEIAKKLVDSFLESFEEGTKVAVFVMPLQKVSVESVFD